MHVLGCKKTIEIVLISYILHCHMILKKAPSYTPGSSIQVETFWPFHPKKVAKGQNLYICESYIILATSYSIFFSLVHHQAKKIAGKVTRVAFAGPNQDSSFWCKNCHELKSEKYDFSPQCFRRNLLVQCVDRRFLQYCSCKSLKVCNLKASSYMVYFPTFTIKSNHSCR